MTKRVCAVAVVALLVIAIGAMPAFAAKYRPETKLDPRIKTSMDFAFRYGTPVEHTGVTGTIDRPAQQSSLGDPNLSDSPGSVMGFTYYELQKNGSIGRRVENRGGAQIHVTFTAGLDAGSPTPAARNQWYNYYDPVSGTAITAGGGTGPGSTYSGFGGIDAVPITGGTFDTRALVAGHYTRGVTRAEVNFQEDGAPFTFDFKVVPESAEPVSSGNPLWPMIEYHKNGSNEYIYLIAMGDSASATDPLYFFRKAGTDTLGTWEGTVIDTIRFQGVALMSSRTTQKVAVAWIGAAAASVNDPGWRADVYYKESTDMGATWPAAPTNITNFPEPGPAPDTAFGYPNIELAGIYDANDNLHLVWNSGIFTDGSYFFSAHIYHWASHIQNLDLVTKHIWNDLGPNCGNGVNNLSTGNKISISECDGNLYTIWSQANDVEGGVYDDCANTTAAGGGLAINWTGNHELWMSVSTDLDGDAWDARRNLTNSYNPACSLNAAAGRGDCNDDVMGSVSRYGQDISALSLDESDYPAGSIVDVDPGYAGSYYLDVTYINDEMPSVSVYTWPNAAGLQGPKTRNNAKWFRIPCVDPVVEARLALNRSSIGFPEYTEHGQLYQFYLKLENIGNLQLNVTGVTENETTGPSGWLDVFPTTVNVDPSGGVDSVQVTLNAGGVVNSPGTVVSLNGSLDFISNAAEGVVSFTIDNFIVADTVVGVNYDTISTGCIRLAVGRNGNMGGQGGENGRANMDYFLSGFECDAPPDTVTDTILGDASVYLYDASPIIMSGTLGNLTASWSIFQDGFATEYGFKPVADLETYGPVTGANYDGWTSGTFVTVDSAIAVEKTWYAPTDGNTPSCGSSFIVQVMKIYSYDGAAHNNLVIGEAMDWDVPSDTGSNNGAGLDFPNNYIYLRGAEYDADPVECQQNNARFGGAAFIGWETQLGGTFNDGNDALNYYGMYTALNEDFVYPRPSRLEGGFDPDELYTNMTDNSGLTANPTQTDQHMVMTLSTDFDLAGNDTLWVYTVFATVRNGGTSDFGAAIAAGRQWYQDNLAGGGGCCVGNTGNVNNDGGGAVDLSDLIYFVNFLFLGGPAPACPAAANINGDTGCALDLSDLIYLVNFLFLGGPAPAA